MEGASCKAPQPAVEWHVLGDGRAGKQTLETSGCRTKMTNLSCEKHFNSVAPSGRWCVFHCERIISVVDDVEIYVLFLIADHTSITLNSHTDITWERQMKALLQTVQTLVAKQPAHSNLQ